MTGEVRNAQSLYAQTPKDAWTCGELVVLVSQAATFLRRSTLDARTETLPWHPFDLLTGYRATQETVRMQLVCDTEELYTAKSAQWTIDLRSDQVSDLVW